MPSAAPPSLEPQVESRYPTVERFVESASKEALPGTFEGLRAELATVKGPKAEHAKKAQAALDRAEELFGHLIDVRERLIEEQKGAKRRR
jgi:hypothetical protein